MPATQVYFTEEQRRQLGERRLPAMLDRWARRCTGIATPDALIAATAILHRP